MQEKTKWFMIRYGDDYYGLKAGDGIQRGVPEGSKKEWLELIESVKNNETYSTQRLAYGPIVQRFENKVVKGIYSPKNSNRLEDYFITNDANLIKILLENPFEWVEDNLPGKPISLRRS